MSFKLITDGKALDKAILSIASRGKKLDNDIWRCAVSAIAHHWADGDRSKGGDVTKINNLVAAMPRGARVNALRDFITAFGSVVYDPEQKIFVHDKNGSADIEGAMAQSWVEFKPEAEYKPFDALAAIKAMAKKAAAADLEKGDKCNKKQQAAILKLAADLGVEL